MKHENLRAANDYDKQINSALKAIKVIDSILWKNPNGSAPMNSFAADKNLWGFHMSEHRNASGENSVDCNGLEVSCEILKFARTALEAKIVEWHEAIKTL